MSNKKNFNLIGILAFMLLVFSCIGVAPVNQTDTAVFTENVHDHLGERFRFVGGEIQGFANNAERITQLVIPNTVWGMTVTSIGTEAFKDAGLTSVVFPDSIKSIGQGAFFRNQITSVAFPNGITSIGIGAFSNNRLINVVIPDSVTYIGEAAFFQNNLRNVIIPDSITSIGDSTFFLVLGGGVAGIASGNASVTIGANVNLHENAFLYYDAFTPRIVNSEFTQYYNQNGRTAGTYRFTWRLGGSWSYSP